jgi:ComF family protein
MFQNHFSTCSLCGLDLAGCRDPCTGCRNADFSLDALEALGAWYGPLREWLSELKYGGDSRMADWLSGKLYNLWQSNWKGLTVVPVPPRAIRLFRNGYDPLGLIAAGMKKRGVPVVSLLRRIGNQTQKSLKREDRLKENSLKYVLRNHIRIDQKAYVLLDDVSTTGATLNYCAEVLKNAGVEKVFGIVVCKD